MTKADFSAEFAQIITDGHNGQSEEICQIKVQALLKRLFEENDDESSRSIMIEFFSEIRELFKLMGKV